MKLRRILALAGAVLLLLLYAASIIFAMIRSPLAQSLLMTSMFCTVIIPAVLYGYTVYLRHVRNRSSDFSKNEEE